MCSRKNHHPDGSIPEKPREPINRLLKFGKSRQIKGKIKRKVVFARANEQNLPRETLWIF
ncbi:MAG: hypothetical protein KUG80_05970 [Gammaproteobacteria bacterium]|nr:hypothetical protein [Gammaproteobacteria bacterium]